MASGEVAGAVEALRLCAPLANGSPPGRRGLRAEGVVVLVAVVVTLPMREWGWEGWGEDVPCRCKGNERPHRGVREIVVYGW